jgi:serine/threonine protein kinase
MDASLEIGAILHERYRIIKVLGSGDFGVVYQAFDGQGSGRGETVAIKQMPMQMIVNCERQADVRAMLTHPAIPRIHDYFGDDAKAYLVLDFVQGRNLEQVLAARGGPVAEETVTDWAIQICDVLDYLHNHPYHPTVFRDLKPNNILVDDQGSIHLVDFGLARTYPPGFFREPQPQFEHLWRGVAIGTEGYSPPEQYQGIAEPRSDLYALGATMHHLLTDRDPRKELAFSFDSHPVHSLNPNVSKGLEAIVIKALSRDVAGRFSSAKEMQMALQALPA